MITVGHFPDALDKALFPLMKNWNIDSTKAIISQNNCAAPEWKWVPSKDILISFNSEVFETKVHKHIVREKITIS